MRTPEQVLREIVAEHVFRIAQILSEIDELKEKNQKLEEENKKLTTILTGPGKSEDDK